MELRIDIDSAVVDWLASMGYPVAGMPREMLQGMLLREARQWQLSPEALRALIGEGAHQTSETYSVNQPIRDAGRQHPMSDRLARLSF